MASNTVMDKDTSQGDHAKSQPNKVESASKSKYPDSLSSAKDGYPPKGIYDAFLQYSPKSDSEVINILVHLTMVDSGYKLYMEDKSSSLPASWRDIATTFKYSRPGYLLYNESTSELVEFTCSIVMVTMGSTKQVLASFVGQDSEISVKFDMKQYTLKDSFEPEKLKKLAHFDCLFRNELLYPLRISAHKILGLPAPWHLLGLPYDIMLLVLKLLPIQDILNLGLTCTAMKAIVDDPRVWYILFKRDFPAELQSADSVTSCFWKDRYKTEYLKRKSMSSSKRFFGSRHSYIPPDSGYPRGQNFYPPNLHDAFPYGPIGGMQPGGPNPFIDPDSQYFGGELAPNPRLGRMGNTPYLPGYGFPRPSRGGPRIQFL